MFSCSFGGGVIVASLEQILNYNLHPLFMVFIAQFMVCELAFEAVTNFSGLHKGMKFEA
jgi:hypothetical protein